MRDPLKEFIQQHRPEMDTAKPSTELWTKIETRMNFAPGIAAKSTPWLKHFFFGASVLTIAAVSYFIKKETRSSPQAYAATTVEQKIATAPATNAAKTIPVNFPSSLTPVVLSPAIPLNVISPTPENSFAALPVIPQNTDTVSPAKNEMPVSFAPANFVKSEGVSLNVDTLFNGITRLEITGSSFDVDVKAHSKNNIHLEGNFMVKSKGNKQHYNITYTRIDTVLKVNIAIEYENERNSCISFGCGNTVNALLSVEVPESINLVIDNRYGDANVSGLRGGIFDARLCTGDLELNNMQTNIKTSLTYGDFTAVNITGNLSARVNTGSSVLMNVTGDVDLSTSYGDISLKTVTGNVKLSGSTGSIEMHNVTGDANVKTAYGDIELDNYKGTPQLVTSTGSISGRNVELTGNTNLTTTYGDITLGLVNELDALSFDLSTTYGDILVDKNGQRIEKENKLNLQKGSILIKGCSSTGSQLYQ